MLCSTLELQSCSTVKRTTAMLQAQYAARTQLHALKSNNCTVLRTVFFVVAGSYLTTHPDARSLTLSQKRTPAVHSTVLYPVHTDPKYHRNFTCVSAPCMSGSKSACLFCCIFKYPGGRCRAITSQTPAAAHIIIFVGAG